MGSRWAREWGIVILAFVFTVPLEAVTVSPSICPTNKIAPRRRHASWPDGTARTFGAFYDLLVPGSGGHGPHFGPQQDGLQEQPQADDPNDCKEIEDYDETDLSSITPQGNRRQGYRVSRDYPSDFFVPQQYSRPEKYPPQNPQRPSKPPRPTRRPPKPSKPQRPPTDKPSHPVKPPYWSGGHFESNTYRPPPHRNPSDSFKPIHEHTDNIQAPYYPTLIGGSLGEIVGVSPVVPTTEDPKQQSTTNSPIIGRIIPDQTRRQRSRNLNSNSVVGSFVNLFFK